MRQIKKPKKGKKFVQIDHRTIIEVDVDKSEEDAIREFTEKTDFSKPKYMLRKKQFGKT